MKERLKALMQSVWTPVVLNVGAAVLNISLAIAYPGPADWMSYMGAGFCLATALWLYLMDKSRKGWMEIIDLQRKMMDEMASTFAQHAQSSHQTFKSSIQKFMEDQDDKPVNPNSPKVH